MYFMQSADILKGLNEKQKESVTASGGPLLIVAGPGSGKTRVLTHRIAYLIKEYKVNPSNILGVTFTNKAAQEMRARLALLLGEKNAGRKNIFSAIGPTIGTFHALGNMILRREAGFLGRKSDFVIYDEDDSVSLIKKTMEDLQINPKQFNPASVKYAISAAKNELVDEAQYQAEAHGLWQETVAKIYRAYQKSLEKNNAFDFDDLIGKMIELFKKNPEVLERYRQKFRHILVDEYQDTNFAQYTLIKMLAEKHKNLCVVGDTDQGIYSWRGADIRNILAFEKDWPEAKVIFLEENYRSTQKILDAAHGLISQNVFRHEKKLFSSRDSGHPVFLYEALDAAAEAGFILEKIQEMSRDSDWKDFAILYRTNAQSRAIEEAFVKSGLPYRIIGGVRFYSRAEIKDILAYLKFIQNPSDLVSLARIINVPSRGIGEKGEKLILSALAESGKDLISWIENADLAGLGLGAKAVAGIKEFCAILSEMKNSRELNLEQGIKKLLKRIKYQAYLDEKAPGFEERLENIKEFIGVAKRYNDLLLSEALAEFLAEASLFEDAGDKKKENSVSLMTLHSAKGLEFKNVFISGLEEGILPHSRSLGDSQQLEEERRLLYVGITRAKEKIYLLYARTRSLGEFTQANSPSRFLREIPEDLIEVVENELGF